MVGRRERLRAETIAQIKEAALARLRQDGDVSLRAVARDIGMSAPGLYRYYDSRDDLLTALIADGYHDLADALEAALGIASTRPSDPSEHPTVVPSRDEMDARAVAAGHDERSGIDRFAVVARAFRAWAVARPNVFGLLYGDPLPGYAAPEGGVTVAATRRVGRALLQPIFEAVLAGELDAPDTYADAVSTPEMVRFVDELSEMIGLDVPRAVAPLALATWGRLHGIVSLEVFGQLHWVYPDGADALFEADVSAMLDQLRARATR